MICEIDGLCLCYLRSMPVFFSLPFFARSRTACRLSPWIPRRRGPKGGAGKTSLIGSTPTSSFIYIYICTYDIHTYTHLHVVLRSTKYLGQGGLPSNWQPDLGLPMGWEGFSETSGGVVGQNSQREPGRPFLFGFFPCRNLGVLSGLVWLDIEGFHLFRWVFCPHVPGPFGLVKRSQAVDQLRPCLALNGVPHVRRRLKEVSLKTPPQRYPLK